jgi:ubiquinone biosynthesis protein COQ9
VTQDLRDSLLVEALSEIPFTGISDATLRAAAQRTGVSDTELAVLFPNGPADLVRAFSHWADAQMQERMALDAPEKIRERITKAVRARIEVLAPHKEAARQAAGFLALPTHAPLAAQLVLDTVDAMWRAAGDQSSDFNYYTKRALLTGVYGSTLIYWFSDSSEGHEATWKFLDSRIGDVMQIQKMRGSVEKAIAKLPDPFGVLASMRMSRPQ